jgi:transposase-like protein
MTSPKTLKQAMRYFRDEQRCIRIVARLRWPDGPHCSHCIGPAGTRPHYLKTAKNWKCRSCGYKFSVKVGTIFENSSIPLQKWLSALWVLVNDENGINCPRLAKGIVVTRKSAWFVLYRLKLALQWNDLAQQNCGTLSPTEAEQRALIGGN